MALQVWLPLNENGNLKNQGLADVTVTNNGATYNSNGKIGGCYKVNGAQLSIPSASYMEMKSGKQFSFACWAKGATSGGWFIACSGWEIQFLTGHINVYPGSSSNNRDSKFNGTTAADLWRHIAFTWDGSNLILYVDGNALNTSTFNVSYNIGSKINFCYQGKRYLNDIRIYDHCLTPQEVKEISKGLVLHYPLNDGNVTNTVYDCSGYCNNGTVSGTLTTNTDTPRYDKCSQGNGNISCSGLTINNPFTISTWIYLPITGTTGNGSSRSELSIGPVNLYKDHDGVDKHTFAITKSDNSFAYLTRFYPPEDKWYHLAIVSDGSTLKIYKNGVASTNSISTKDGKTNFSIMLSNNIKLSDLRLYATALSEDDIKELYNTAAFIDHKGNVGCYLFYEDADSQVMKTGQVKTGEFVENYDYLYLPAGVYVNTGLQYTGNTCKAETILRYASGGSKRDLMGFSGIGSGYWGVTANGTWEGHGTFSYTNSDITVLNKISYEYTGETGTYLVGALNNSYSSRSKYIYRIKLYKNGVLERDLYPCKGTNKNGLVDVLTGTFYPASANTATLGNDSETRITKVYDKYIECNQLIEI